MNRKNILISFGFLGMVLIFYKLLFGLVLPIALFVGLGYTLKFLLKGTDSDSVKEDSQIPDSIDSPSSIKKILEIKPVEENKFAEEDKSD